MNGGVTAASRSAYLVNLSAKGKAWLNRDESWETSYNSKTARAAMQSAGVNEEDQSWVGPMR